MKKICIISIIVLLIGLGVSSISIQLTGRDIQHKNRNNKKIELPKPKFNSFTSIEQALLKRRSVRAYKNESLTLLQVSQLLWAAQGITDFRKRYRTAPSAGALYPLEVYVVIANVVGVTKGIYKYGPYKHEITRIKYGDAREELSIAARGQRWVGKGAIIIILSAVYERTTQKYGNRGVRYVYMEAGHAAQNICLQAVSLKLGVVTVGAFKDKAVREILKMSDKEHPLYLISVGKI